MNIDGKIFRVVGLLWVGLGWVGYGDGGFLVALLVKGYLDCIARLCAWLGLSCLAVLLSRALCSGANTLYNGNEE